MTRRETGCVELTHSPRKLIYEWQDIMTPREIYEKVKTFFHFYGINRHKSKGAQQQSDEGPELNVLQ